MPCLFTGSAEPPSEKLEELNIGGAQPNGAAEGKKETPPQSSRPPPTAPDDGDEEEEEDEVARQKREAELKEIHTELAKEDSRWIRCLGELVPLLFKALIGVMHGRACGHG